RAPSSTLFPYTTLFRSDRQVEGETIGSNIGPNLRPCLLPINDNLSLSGTLRGTVYRNVAAGAVPGREWSRPLAHWSLACTWHARSEEHTSELQSLAYLV